MSKVIKGHFGSKQIVNAHPRHCQKLGRIFTGSTNKFLLSCTVISYVCRTFSTDNTFYRYCLAQRISKFLWSFEILYVKQYLINLMSLASIRTVTVYETPSEFSFSKALGMADFAIFNNANEYTRLISKLFLNIMHIARVWWSYR